MITVAVHTYDYAMRLKAILEHEGVDVTIQNINLTAPHVSAGVRMRISEAQLPLALRIIENPDVFQVACDEHLQQSQPVVMVPVDFSLISEHAARIAFTIANAHHARVKLVHSYIAPSAIEFTPLNSELDLDAEATMAMEDTSADNAAEAAMKRFEARMRHDMKQGLIPVVAFDSQVNTGLPEEVIVETAKHLHPMLIVMGTRGTEAKQRNIMGSVTAEVLDMTRYPVLTVADAEPSAVTAGHINVLFFATADQDDIVAFDAMMRLLCIPQVSVKLVCIPPRKNPGQTPEKIEKLAAYLRTTYPDVAFTTAQVDPAELESHPEKINLLEGIDIIGVPNKKKNLLARFFNPSLAHKLIFRTDVPMMVIPV